MQPGFRDSGQAANAKRRKGFQMTRDQKIMQAMGDGIVSQIPEGWGFVLMVFPPNPKDQVARANYISNCPREQIVELLLEFIQRTKGAWAKDKHEGDFGMGKK
jgi:hypothetical protein